MERNKELEGSIKDQQTVIDDQSQEIEVSLMTCFCHIFVILRDVNDSHYDYLLVFIFIMINIRLLAKIYKLAFIWT